MNEQQQVKEILTTRIVVDYKCEKIKKSGNIILSGQEYYRQEKPLSIGDPDMSDLAVGFYKIIYKKLLLRSDNNRLDDGSVSILNEDGRFREERFAAGDTMNSFKTTANRALGYRKSMRTPEEEWRPVELKNFFKYTHCLANFWILPMDIGRNPRSEHQRGKPPYYDYMDLYLAAVKEWYDKETFPAFEEYFKIFGTTNPSSNDIKFSIFCKNHFIYDDNYLEKNGTEDVNVNMYSQDYKTNIKSVITAMVKRIEGRAETISKEYTQELGEYFESCGLI